MEYVRAIIPPLYLASFKHDDWVSSVDVLSAGSLGSVILPGQERILSGSYDGLFRVWNMSSEVLVTAPPAANGGHTASVKAAKFIDESHIASAGMDHTVRIWKYSEDQSNFSASVRPQLHLYGHKASIDALAVHGSSSRMLSASADHFVGLWSTKKSDAPSPPQSLVPSAKNQGPKRRKMENTPSAPQRGPLAMLKGHTASVSDTSFAPNDHTVAYSTSWDHTLKTWDLPTSTCVDTRSTAHSLFSLTTLPTLSLVAAGTSARHITLIDPRASATSVSAMTLRGHTNAVVSLHPDPKSPYSLVSGSHDGTCRIWDVRSSKSDRDGRVGESVYTIDRESVKGQRRAIAGEGVKVFGVCWNKDVGIVSAGEDKRVQINQGTGMTSKKA